MMLKKVTAFAAAALMALPLIACGSINTTAEPSKSAMQDDVQEYITQMIDKDATISYFSVDNSEKDNDTFDASCIATYQSDVTKYVDMFELSYSISGNKWDLDKISIVMDYDGRSQSSLIEETKEKSDDDVNDEKNEEPTEKPTEKTTEEPTEKAKETEPATEEEPQSDDGSSEEISEASIIGKWEMNGVADEAEGIDSAGLIFDENGIGSFYEGTTDIMYFENGGMNIGGEFCGEEYITYDGTTFILEIEGTEMINMVRRDNPNPNSYDGSYRLISGVLYDAFLESMEEEAGSSDDVYITMNFSNGTSEVVFDHVFEYEIDGSKITLKNYAGFFGEMIESDSDEGYFEVSGDILKFKGSENDSEALEMKRVK